MDQDVKSFKDLIVWHRLIELCVAIYDFTREFLKGELFGLRSQLQRAAVPVSSNIAEDAGRRSTGEFMQFLSIAKGSDNEVQRHWSSQASWAMAIPSFGYVEISSPLK